MGVKVVKDVDKTGFQQISKPIQDKLASDLGPNAVKVLEYGSQRKITRATTAGSPPGPPRPPCHSDLNMRFDGLVLQEQRHLKWRALDPLENLLMILCGIAITGFSVVVLTDVLLRAIGRPWFLAQEATMTFFLYGIFFGVAAATRRNDHLYLAVLAEAMTGGRRLFFELFNRAVVLGVALCMIYFGYLNFLDGFKSLRMPSMTPLAALYIAIPDLWRSGRAVHH